MKRWLDAVHPAAIVTVPANELGAEQLPDRLHEEDQTVRVIFEVLEIGEHAYRPCISP